ncbi:MAG: hypothetical protein KIS96_03640 [Bauldia sp.]|nr:hypothetical protein [Bauldia sp.]
MSRAREVDILSAATRLGAKLRRTGREWVGPCPSCGGKDRFSINPAKRVFNCRGAQGGDVIAMVEHVQGYDFVGAVAWITGEQPPDGRSAGVDPAAEERARRRRAESERKRAAEAQREERKKETARETAYRWWREARPLIGSVAESYLRGRGIDFDLTPYSNVLRCHPGLSYPFNDAGEVTKDGPVLPALVCAVQHHTGQFRGLWRIFLKPDGSGKAPVVNPKLGKGPCAGGGVWLGPRSGILNTCEGVETGLGIVGILGGRETIVATLSTSLMQDFDVSHETPLERVWPDGDSDRIKRRSDGREVIDPAPGRRAAEARVAKETAAGRRCVMQDPPSLGRDFLDVYVATRRAA